MSIKTDYCDVCGKEINYGSQSRSDMCRGCQRPISKLDILHAVMRERAYQDSKWGTTDTNPHTIFEWIGIMEKELQEAKGAYFQRPCDPLMLVEVLQVIAVGFACLEQHGIVNRSDLDKGASNG